jgi:hypothetical protein
MMDRRRKPDRQKIEEKEGRVVAIYHRVYESENLETAAQMIVELVQSAQEKFPGCERHLYVDIDAHRNAQGGFDADMLALQKEFLVEIARFVTKAHFPLLALGNPAQQNDVPSKIVVVRE